MVLKSGNQIFDVPRADLGFAEFRTGTAIHWATTDAELARTPTRAEKVAPAKPKR